MAIYPAPRYSVFGPYWYILLGLSGKLFHIRVEQMENRYMQAFVICLHAGFIHSKWHY